MDDRDKKRAYPDDISKKLNVEYSKNNKAKVEILLGIEKYIIDFGNSVEIHIESKKKKVIRNETDIGQPRMNPPTLTSTKSTPTPSLTLTPHRQLSPQLLYTVSSSTSPSIKVDLDSISSVITDLEECSICLDEEDADGKKSLLKLNKCVSGHAFHASCIKKWLEQKLQCPVCSKCYGKVMGFMPNGTMTATLLPRSMMPLSGSTFDTIVIQYSLPSGTQGNEHPSPGARFHGTNRTAYLEYNAEGIEVLELLVQAFRQRLTFTIGTSQTSGLSNVVVWNGIHHKTSTSGGASRWGFPDTEYYSRVKDELQGKGIQ